MGPNRPLTARLGRHFAACAAVTVAAAHHANADVIYSGVRDLTIASTTNGLYLNVLTGAFNTTGGGGATVPGWDVNPYSSTGLTFFNPSAPTGGVYARVSAATAGVSNLPANTVIGSTSLWTSGAAQTTGSNPFVFNSDQNIVGFRFTNESGGTVHFGWMRVRLAATLAGQPRTLVEWAYESTPNTPILAGDTGGPPADYDPCATTNPTVSNGSSTPPYRTDTVADLSTCGGTIPAANYYKFTTGDAGSYTFQTCPTSGSATIALLSACDGSASVLGCGASACDGTGSSVTAVLNAATTVYVVVGGSGLGNTVPVVVTAPPIGICVNAANAAYGDNVISSTQGSATSQNVFNNVAQSAQDTIFKPQWFRFTPTATGDFSFKTCLSGDTKLAIGTGCPTPGGVFTTIAYNDDAPTCFISGTSTNSWGSWIDATNNGASGFGAGFPLTQQLVAGQTYYICVGAYGATDTVAGFLNISGPEGAPCRPDLNNDDVVNGDDLGILLAQWGACATPCSADFNDDGNVNGDDLGVLLGAWGACP